MLDEFDLFKDFLSQQKLRWTPQRKMILETFLSIDGHVDIESLHRKIGEQDPSIGIATLYRTLKLLVDCDVVEAHSFHDGKKTYERKFHVRHHDHLICTLCGVVEEFQRDDLDRVQSEVAKQQGFRVLTRQFKLYGLCAQCDERSSEALR